MLKKVLSVLLVCTLIAAMSVTVMAASDVKIISDSMYTLPMTVQGVTDTTKCTINSSQVGIGRPGSESWLWGTNASSINVYTVSKGAKIDISEHLFEEWDKSPTTFVYSVENKGGTLTANLTPLKLTNFPRTGKLDTNGRGDKLEKGSYIQLNETGLFLIVVKTGSPTGSGNVAVVNVKGGSTASTDKTTTTVTEKATTKAPDKTTTTAPATKDTVKIAGENRTPGELQTRSSGDYLYTVKSGDTMYDLAKRFYGNGNLWKDLQKANQKWLDETKDGTIFVGYNLIIPAELGGVRAKA